MRLIFRERHLKFSQILDEISDGLVVLMCFKECADERKRHQEFTAQLGNV